MNRNKPESAERRSIRIGRLGRTVGLDGGLLFRAEGPSEAALVAAPDFPGTAVEVEGAGKLIVRAVRSHSRGHVLHFEGVRRVERAQVLVNATLNVASGEVHADFEPSDPSSALEGLPVLLAGEVVGTITRIEGARGFEYATLEPGGQLLPLNAPYVKLAEDAVTLVDPPPGLL